LVQLTSGVLARSCCPDGYTVSYLYLVDGVLFDLSGRGYGIECAWIEYKFVRLDEDLM
jgi:hypothetical protein